MGFRKTLVKLLNLVYIAGAGVAIYSICTRDIVNVNLSINMTSEQVGKFIGGAFNKRSEVKEREYTYTRADDASISDWLTQEKIAEAFPDGLHAGAEIKVPFTKAFEFNNQNIIKELVVDNLNKIVDNSLDTVSNALYILFKEGAEHFAMSILEEQLNETIEQLFPSDNEQGVAQEDVQEIFDNVYALVEEDEATVDDIAQAILGEDENSAGLLKILNDKAKENGEYFVAHPTEEEITEDLAKELSERKYFVLHGELLEPNNQPYDSGITYYIYRTFAKVDATPEDIQHELDKPIPEDRKIFVKEDGHFIPVYEPYVDFETIVANEELIVEQLAKEEAKRSVYVYNGEQYVVVSEAYDSAVTYYARKLYYQEYDASKINTEYIAQAMVNELESVPGLVTRSGEYERCTPNESQINDDLAKPVEQRVYFVKVGENQYDPNTEPFNSETEYYKEKIIINNVQDAIATLLDEMLNGGSTSGGGSRAVRARADELTSESSEKDLRNVLAEFVNKYLPLEVIESASAKVGNKAAYILVGVVAIFAAPWIWFAFITLIRTLRRKKVWTRTAIIFVWAIPQVILGLVLTYGMKYGLQIAADKIEALKKFADMIDLNVKFSCLIPSFIYLGMIPFTIFYLIVAHPVKTEYKLERVVEKRERERMYRERRMKK